MSFWAITATNKRHHILKAWSPAMPTPGSATQAGKLSLPAVETPVTRHPYGGSPEPRPEKHLWLLELCSGVTRLRLLCLPRCGCPVTVGLTTASRPAEVRARNNVRKELGLGPGAKAGDAYPMDPDYHCDLFVKQEARLLKCPHRIVRCAQRSREAVWGGTERVRMRLSLSL